MNPNYGYQLYQAERTQTRAEVLAGDAPYYLLEAEPGSAGYHADHGGDGSGLADRGATRFRA